MRNFFYKKWVKREIKRNVYVPFFQGIYNFEKRSIKGVEVLARKKVKGRYLSPAAFLSEIESSELMSEFTQSIIYQSLTLLNNINISNTLDISINVPPSLIEEQSFIQFIQTKVVGCYDADKFNLILELTESSRIANRTIFTKNIKLLQKHGLKFYIDDFGKDYCDFDTYFSDLKIKDIKIDRSIVNGSQNTLQAVINFADTLSADLIAEGVETREKSQELLKLGIKHHQGFIYSKPSVIEKVALSI
ncbi:EAL domain-containing protein [Photobacterium leiognathi]|uniref:EAL domain-containing protein n=1 Tax=Photobacterium leiognathi TaxID=553611 RepID=UPI0029811D5A|nr:EAL domain-containing protein [Photobacterium leiognathi]